MEIGCHLPTTQAAGAAREALLTFAREAEKRNIASLWVSVLELVATAIRPAVDAA